MTSTSRKLPRGRIRKDEGAEARFFAFVEKTDTCWNWIGFRNEHGYGRWRWRGRTQGAHRASYEMFVRDIPDGMFIDHLCRNRSCVNPDHLEPVSNEENILRGESPPAMNRRKSVCPAGHEYDAANTYVSSRGYRQCKRCNAARARRYKAARRAAQKGGPDAV